MAVSEGMLTSPAGRYAKALFSEALEEGTLQNVQTTLLEFSVLYRKEKMIKETLESAFYTAAQKIEIWDEIVRRKQILPLLARFITFLVTSKRMSLFTQIYHIFESLVEAHQGILPLTVTASHPLSGKQKEALESELTKRYKNKIRVVYQEDASLLAGFRIQCQSEIIDLSLKGRFTQLTDVMKMET